MTVMLTGAVVGAARKLKDKMARIAAQTLEAAPEDIVFGADGAMRPRRRPTRSLAYADIGLKAYWFKLDLPRRHGERAGGAPHLRPSLSHACPPPTARTSAPSIR